MEWVSSLPDPYAEKMKSLYEEMADRSTLEAKIYKPLTVWRLCCSTICLI